MFKFLTHSAFLLSIIMPTNAQDELQALIDGSLDTSSRLQEIRALDSEEPRELNVLIPTIAPEEIDRAVLNRLIQDITNRPEQTKTELSINDSQLQDISITISNARSFINNRNNSEMKGEPRYKEALDAYKWRAQFTKDFIAKYYRIVLMDVEAVLDGPSLVRFTSYMEDRRRRMAASGATTWGIVAENVTSGKQAVDFHCHRN